MPFEIVPHGTRIDFVGKRHIALVVSGALLLAALVALGVRGMKFGIDFAGGTEVQVLFAADTSVDEGAIRAVVEACGVASPSVVRYGETAESEFLIRFREVVESEGGVAGAACPIPDDVRARLDQVDADAGTIGNAAGTAAVVDRLAAAIENTIGKPQIQRVEFVGPRVGGELRRDGLLSMAIACAMILAYLAFRFSARFAPGAVIALVHDVGITAGLFVIFGIEFDLRVLAALLAIIGYSLNDTIIVYDRIRENMALRTKHDLVEVLNLSVNQTLSRTLLTSMTTLLAVTALLVFGGQMIWPFAAAMFIGVIVGTYSSVFIAAPTLLFLENYFGDRSGSGSGSGGKSAASKA